MTEEPFVVYVDGDSAVWMDSAGRTGVTTVDRAALDTALAINRGLGEVPLAAIRRIRL